MKNNPNFIVSFCGLSKTKLKLVPSAVRGGRCKPPSTL